MSLLLILLGPTSSTVSGQAGESSGLPWQQAVLALIAFAAVAFFSVRIGRRSFATAKSNRNERIARQQEASMQSQADGASVRERYEAQLLDASDEVNRIIDAGREHAARVSAEVTQEGRDRLEAVRAQANADADALRVEALADVRDEAATLATDLAQSLVRTDLDHVATRRLIDEYLNNRRPEQT